MWIKLDQMKQMFEWFQKNDPVILTKDDCVENNQA